VGGRAALAWASAAGGCSLIQDPGQFTFVDDASMDAAARDAGPNTDGGPGECTTASDCPPRSHATLVCTGGTCSLGSCEPGYGDCDGDPANGCETNTDTELDHCGACDASCTVANGEGACASGTCTVARCSAGYDDCDGDAADGCETDLRNAETCGACGNDCTASGSTPLCNTLVMPFACAADCGTATRCGSSCIDTSNDPGHCGGCMMPCPSRAHADLTCVSSTCGFNCQAGYDDCDAVAGNGCEANLDSNVMHCGMCGRACAGMGASWVCASGDCEVGGCDPLFGDCDMVDANGCERALTDVANCGLCGRTCGGMNATWSCPAGVCNVATCAAGYDDCDGVDANGCESVLATDDLNCGACGNACMGDETCVAGSCTRWLDVDVSQTLGCAVNAAHQVFCWGDDISGQLGQGTVLFYMGPQRVHVRDAAMVEQPIQQVATGTFHACAITDAGRLYCWGRGLSGELGDGTGLNRLTPVAVTSSDGVFGSRTFVTIHAGGNVSCALDSTGDVWCWGRNDFGLIPTVPVGGSSFALSATRVSLPAPAAQLAMVGSNACALLDDATVVCWGHNAFGGCGVGTLATPCTPTTRVTLMGGGPLADVRVVGVGGSFACAGVGPTRQMYCWGLNNNQQFGIATTQSNPNPVMIPGVTGLVRHSGGDGMACWNATGGPRCAGSRFYSAIGDGLTSGIASPTQPLTTSADAIVRAGNSQACAIDGRSILCWGDNRNGPLGREHVVNRPMPTPLGGATSPLASVTSIAGSGYGGCAIAGGEIRCWGSGNEGQIGNGARVSTAIPTMVPSPGGMPAGVGANAGAACGIFGGQAYCWGQNFNNRLAIGTAINVATPSPTLVQLSGAEDEIALSANHTCARQGGNVYCWGLNNDGEAGQTAGTPSNVITPTLVPGLANAVQISLGERVSCARRSDGRVSCWGYNQFMGAGAGAVTGPNPQDVLMITHAVDLEMGWTHGCAIEGATAGATSGQVYCWGNNAGFATSSSGSGFIATPVLVPTSLPAVSVAAGSTFSCAVLTDGTVECWGDATMSQLGDGSSMPRAMPMAVPTITDAVEVGSGGVNGFTVIVRRATGGAVTWGYNGSGACGTGEVLFRPSPAMVQGL
ncbi:MAG: hypothetical protein AB7S26_29375, partial [Sandaracinaceae bacterium]